MKKKSIIGFVSAITGLLIICATLITSTVMLHNGNKAQQQKLENIYKMNIYSLTDSANKIESNMSMLMVSADKNESNMLADDTFRHSVSALNALNALPVEYTDTINTVKFLNQLGDFCGSYVKAQDGVEFDQKTDILYQNCVNFKNNVSKINPDNLVLSERGIMTVNYNSPSQKSAYEGMVYDGPFSDNAPKKQFKGLKDCPSITQKEAEEKALEIFSFLNLRNLQYSGTSLEPKAYNFLGDSKNGKILLSMSAQGGKPITATAMDSKSEIIKSEEFYNKKAIEYANECGYHSLVPVLYNESGNTVFVNLAPLVDDVICYPDLVKIKLSGSGDFCGIEASGHCTCCCEREFSTTVSREEAAKAVNPKIKITSSRLALISKDSKEVLCYEFTGTYNNMDYYIYVDANTGKQCNIIRI